MMEGPFSNFAIIGNGGGGESTLARKIAEAKGLPLLDVDPIQFASEWKSVASSRVSKHPAIRNSFQPLMEIPYGEFVFLCHL